MTNIIRLGIITLVLATYSKAAVSQEDWKLPKVDESVRIDYVSTPIKAKGKEICAYYTDMVSSSEVMQSMIAKMDDKGVKWFSDTKYIVTPMLMETSMEDITKYAGKSRCNPSQADTLYGNLTVSIFKTSVAFTHSGTKHDLSEVKCRYRIIFHQDNHYEIAFKGFLLTSSKISKGKIDKTEFFLDDVYNEKDPSKDQKNFYRDLKLITSSYNEVLTNFFLRKVKSEF